MCGIEEWYWPTDRHDIPCAVSSVLHAAFAAHKADALDKQSTPAFGGIDKENDAYAGISSHDNFLAVVMFGRISQTGNERSFDCFLAHAD